jgi:hypothetical protein
MTKGVLLAGAFSALLMAGCGDTPEIVATQKYAKMQEQAADVFPRIASDYYDSCIRTAGYTLLSDPPKVLNEKRLRTEMMCDLVAKEAKKAVSDTNALIIGYLTSLGNLAKGEAVEYKPQIDDITKSLNTLPGLNGDQSGQAVDAGASLARFLLKIVASGYQKQQLGQSITNNDEQLQVLVKALSIVVGQDYVSRMLKTERLALDSYYSLPIGIAKAQPRKSSLDEYVEYTLNSAWLEKQGIIRDKQAVAEKYINLLKQISCDHSKLKDIYTDDRLKTSETSNPFCRKADQLSSQAISKNTRISELQRRQKLVQSLNNYTATIEELSRLSQQVYTNK